MPNRVNCGQRRARSGPLRFGLAAAVTLLVIELTSWLVATASFGRGFLSTVREERLRVASGATPAIRSGDEIDVPSALEAYKVHPYIGFVADPASRAGPVKESEGRLETTKLGFFRRAGESRADARNQLRIGVFGGSVAFLFSLTVDRALESELQGWPLARGREIAVESFALPGHKQPQQLFALLYLLLVGERFDVVINVDGFNELALPLTENLPQGTPPDYPRSWGALASHLGRPELLRKAGEIVVIRDRRRSLARALSFGILDGSPTAALAWKLTDSSLRSRQEIAEAALGETPTEQHGGNSDASAAAGVAAESSPPSPPDDDAILARLVALWRDSSLQMHRLCAANGIRYVHVLQPNQYAPGAKTPTPLERRTAFREDHPYRRAIERGYPRLIEAGAVLTAAGVSFHDLSRVFASSDETLFVDDCCHFNRRGNTILASRLAEILKAEQQR